MGHAGSSEGSACGPGEDAAARVAALEAEVASLRAEAERVRLILGSASEDAIVTLSMGGRITGWNAGARKIFGYEEGEILGRPGEVFFTPEERAAGAFVGEMCAALENGRAPNERWHVRKDGTRFWASGSMLPLLDEQGRAQGFLNVLRDRTDVHAEAERRALMLAEMNHRVKNVLALVQAVASQSLRHAPDLAAFRASFNARLTALARSHDALNESGWDGAPLRDVVGGALAPHDGAPGRVVLDGPPVLLPQAAVVTLGLAFHELATNAVKYGALSVEGGGVAVRWTLRRARDGTNLVDIFWREHDGPPVTPPERRGFGSRLLQHGLTQEFGGSVRMEFAPGGLECLICLPLNPPGAATR